LNFVVLGFGYSTGSVLFDPTLPISNVKANLNIPTAGYGRTFGLFGRQGLLTVGLPYAWGDISGAVSQQSQSIRRSGLADTRVKFSLNLRGNPARSPAAFAQLRKRSFIVGTSVTVSAPSGQCDPSKLIQYRNESLGIQTGARYLISGQEEARSRCLFRGLAIHA
jgi:hypothetical protein